MALFFLINSLAGGGAETVLIRIAKYLKPKKIFLLERDVKYPIEEENLTTFLSSHTRSVSPVFKSFYIPIYAIELSKNISTSDIVVSFLERANFVNIAVKYLKGHKVIISVHIDPISGHRGIRGINKILIKTLYARADYVVTVSEGVAYSLESLGIPRNKMMVIYNPISLREITQRSEEDIEKIFNDKDFLITVGRLTKAKGQWHLLRIFKEVKKDFPELKLLLLGEGELKDYLVNLSLKLGFKTYVWDRDRISPDYEVYFMGFKENPFKYIARAKLFILSSLWEGFPNVVVEALACKTTVIASDCRSGPREILAPDTEVSYQTRIPEFTEFGVLMPVLESYFIDPEEGLTGRERVWLDTIVSLLKDENLRKSYQSKAIERAKNFDINKIIGDWYRLLQYV
ncbi:MAG: glycosyltransferase [bacterium]